MTHTTTRNIIMAIIGVLKCMRALGQQKPQSRKFGTWYHFRFNNGNMWSSRKCPMTINVKALNSYSKYYKTREETLRTALQETIVGVKGVGMSSICRITRGRGVDGIGKDWQVCRDEWEIVRTLCTRLRFKWGDVEMAVIIDSRRMLYFIVTSRK